MKITIRPHTESDFGQLLYLFKEFAIFEKLPEKMTNSLEQMHAEKEYFQCFVAETPNNEIVGYTTYFYCYYTWTGKSLYLDDLYIRPDFRGNGIGTLLINRIIEYAKENMCNKLRWQVSGWNKPAIEFYKKLGAEINDIEQNCDLILK